MKWTSLFLLVILSLLAAISVVNAAELYSSNWDKGVVVVLYGSQYGTGWWVSKQHLVTAAHVVSYRTNAKVTLIHGDYQAIGFVVYVDSLHDVAVIKAEKSPAYQYIWSLSAKDPEKGQTIFVVGYPFELYKIVGDIGIMSANPRVAEGIIAWVYPDKQLFEFQAATDAGNSGGPIVDNSGNVVGLVSFALTGEAATMYYGTSVSAIKTALQKAGVNYKVGLSSLITSPNSSLSNQVLIAAVGGGVSALVSTIIVLSVRGRRG